MKKITLMCFCLLGSILTSSAQFTQNFDAGITTPVGWTVNNGGDTNTWVFGTPGAGTANSGTNVAKIVYDAAIAHDDYLVSPQFTVTSGVSEQLSLWARQRSDTFPEPFDILLSTTGTASAAFTTTIAAAVTPNTTWQKFVYSLTAYAGQTVNIAFRSTTTNEFELYLDDVVVGAIPSPPEYVNLQYPPTASFVQGGNVTVYGQIYKAGLTDTTTGQAPGISAWVGISPMGSNTNPNTWTTWIPATFNVESNNNDEYNATIGATLAPGTFYYATRFQLNGGAYFYGGYTPTGGGFWNGTSNISGTLTVTAPPVPANDNCTGATALIPGGVFADHAITNTMLGATLTAGIIPSCQATNSADVWYSVQVPASGNLTIETQVAPTTSLIDTVVVAFSGACGTLVPVGCDDDGGLAGPNNLMSILSLTGQTPGAILFIGVWKYSTVAPDGTSKDFQISVYDASLGNNSFDNANFSLYPNPVKDVLNLSYNQEISNVEVYNLLGQKVVSNKYNSNSAQVDMSNLSMGAYVVQVTANGQVKTIKVIKE